MAKSQGLVHKIYRIETDGFPTVHQQFTTLSADLAKIKKQIIELQGMKLSLSGKDLDAVNKKIVEASEVQTDLEKKIAGVNEQNKLSVGNYFQLNKAYQVAKKNAQDLAAAHGIESKEAIEAAATAAAYKQQLIEINNLIKTGGKATAPVIPLTPVTTPTEIPFTTNLDQLAAEREALKETGDALSDFDREQAAASISAAEFGRANAAAADQVQESTESVSQIKTKYEEFTGTLRQNILAQIDNENSLIKNRAQQKEIEKAMTDTGRATDSQTNKLASLREEEQILIESNKALTLTIRNQAKEFNAAIGSLDEQQAQLNQLQQTYEQLSDSEKTSLFGKNLKSEIDVLEPKVKSLEAELGKFSRNVGNYPQIFGGAFKVLEDELDSVQGKLVSGNFGGKELDDLVAKEKVLTNATKVLGTTFATTNAQAAAYKETGRQIAATFGKESQVFKDFSAQVAAGNQQLKSVDVQLTKVSGSGNKVTGVFKKISGGLRSIANMIPGLGISSLILLLITPLQALGSSLLNMGKKSREAGRDLEDFAKKEKIANDIRIEAAKGYAEEVTRIDLLRRIITDHTLSIDKRRTAVDEYNKIADEGNKIDKDSINNTKLIEDAINRQILLIQKRALAKAAENVITKKAEELFLKQLELESRFPDFSDRALEDLKKTAQGIIKEKEKISGIKGVSAEELLAFADLPEVQIEEIVKKNERLSLLLDKDTRTALLRVKARQKYIDSVRKNEFGGQAGVSVLVDDINTLNDELQRTTEVGIGFISDIGGQFDKAGKSNTDKLSVSLQNALKIIEETRLTELAIENDSVNKIQELRELTFDEEIAHLKKMQKINVDAFNDKIKLFSEQQKLNLEEKRAKAEFAEQRSSINLETSKKINDIEKKRFEKGVKDMESQLDSELKQIESNKNAVIDNIESTETQKAQAQLDADLAEQAAREKFYNALLSLSDKYNKDSVQKAKDAIDAINREIKKDRDKVTVETIGDIKRRGDEEIAAEQRKFALQRNAILNNQKITASKRKKQLEDLQKAEERTILAIELKTIQAQLEVIKILYSFGLIAEKQFLDAQAKLIEKANELANKINTNSDDAKTKLKKKFSDLKSFIQSGLRDLFKIDEDSEEDRALGEIIAQSYQLAFDAMSNFYEAERQRIEENLDLQLERIDMDKEQAIARAQSQAEIDSLEKQAEDKKKKARQEAGQLLKKTRKAEAKIALAAELANIAVQASAYPFPASLIIGGVLSGLALGRYAVRVSEINREKFAFGGKPGEVPVKGGKFGGRPHNKGGTDFTFKKKKYNAQVKELAVVRTQDAPQKKVYTVTGNQMQLASAANVIGGGINFKPGAKLKLFESGGYLGQNLQAPVFTPSSANMFINNGGMSKDQFEEMLDKMETIADEQSKRIDRLEVHQVTSTVTKAQRKEVKQAQIGTL